ncbi:MAG TPA: type VI secretion protein IcmF/TssM N-terminal domain-containing protein, partial [Tepidisphaeraceae bacterium]|nr:type VI secretion protein IcmF/TssM N-terminal domain-containing protein [Tepidisphaeraceae bacterium]
MTDQRNLLGVWAKVGLALMGAGAIGAAAWFYPGDWVILGIVAGGVLVVALLLMVLALILRGRQRGKAQPLERAVFANAASQPQRVSEPSRRAMLDDLRKKFEGGVSKLKAAGKDLYSLPWYVLVGEPGSGKTEAIRHSNVGFPPGLQDPAQGAGGTLNMNWWFTNHAVILDTAGRLMFSEAPAGNTGEWDEFLRLLTRARPRCPINGMILVLPADSLIRDTEAEIDAKATRIADQLSRIQRLLGVRFPVFVLVTKCDLVHGFREFFEDLTDPQMRQQMLGWSNPGQLDKPFDPELVERHLRGVKDRLVRRRQALLLIDPMTEDADTRRLDRVDSLYAFPEAFVRLAAPLRRYLETAFVAGEWSPRPLFLRGIYFTSSVREGQALDAELAQALRVPVESIGADGKAWERERAFFLRDMFVNKVFRERGLVTRAKSARRVQRRRRATGLIACCLGAAALLVATWVGSRQLEESVGRQSRYWSAVRANWGDRGRDWAVVQPDGGGGKAFRYNGGHEIALGDARATVGTFFADAAGRAVGKIDVPWVFRAHALIGGDLDERRKAAYRRLYEQSVLRPTIEACRQKLASINPAGGDLWGQEATDAVAELIRLDLQAAKVPVAERADAPLLNLDVLMRFLLTPEAYATFRAEHRAALQEPMSWLYDDSGKDGATWPPAATGAGTKDSAAALEAGVKAMNRYFARALAGETPRLARVRTIADELDKFTRAEDALVAAVREAGTDGPRSAEEFARLAGACRGALRDAGETARRVDAALAAQEKSMAAGQSLLALYEIMVDRELGSAERAYERLTQQIPDGRAPIGQNNAPAPVTVPPALVALRAALGEAARQVPGLRGAALSEDVQNALARADRLHLRFAAGLDGKEHREYQVRAAVWEGAGKWLARTKAGGGDAAA